MNVSATFNETKLLNQCRICLLKEGEWLMMMLYGKNNINIRTMYEDCTGIKVQEEDNLPKRLCTDCLNGLIATHSFILKCKQADTVLRSFETMLTSEEPAWYKLLAINGDSRIEFEYEDPDQQHTVIKELVKSEFSGLKIEQLQEIISEHEVISDNLLIKNCDEEVVLKQDIADICSLANINDSTSVEENYKFISMEHATEIEDDTLNSYCDSVEELTNYLNNQISKLTNNCENESTSQDNKVLKDTFTNMICNICLKAFRHKDSLIIHMRSHAREKPFHCSVCRSQFVAAGDLTRHLRVHIKEKLYACDICGKDFIQFTNLKLHKRLHCAEDLEKIYCKGSTNSLCSYCGLTFISNQSYMKHLQSAHSNTEVKHDVKALFSLRCKVCGRYLSSKSSLKVHMAIHIGMKNYLCTYCGRKFLVKSVMEAHLSTHTGDRPYKCNYCHKAFSQRSTLKSHQHIHTGIRPYQCKLCPKAFKQSHQLSYHVLTHTGEKRYSCTECGKKLATKRILIEHKRIHTGETPYTCTYCDKEFKCYSGFKKHHEIHKKMKNEPLN